MKNLATFLVLLFLPIGIAFAQNPSVFKRLHGTSIKKTVFIKIDESDNKIKYNIDDDGPKVWNTLDGNVFNVSNDRRNEINVYLKFYNPLRYKVVSEMTEEDDPVYTAISQFLSSLPSYSSTISGSGNTQITEPISINPATLLNNKSWIEKLKEMDEDEMLDESTLLYLWRHEFEKIKKKDAELTNEFNKIFQIEKFIYGNIIVVYDDKISENTVVNWIKTRKDALFAAKTRELFNTELTYSKSVLKSIKAERDTATKNLSDIILLLTKNYKQEVGSQIETAKDTLYFFKFSAATAASVKREVNSSLDEYNKIIDVFENLLTQLDTFLQKYPKDNDDYRLEGNHMFDWEYKKLKIVNYNFTPLNAGGSEDISKKTTAKFTMAKDQRIVPFVSTGLLYTDFFYRNYAVKTESGVNLVAETDRTVVRIRPALYLNCLFKTSGDVVYPFIQLGISTGVNDAIFPFGVGLSIRNDFSISGGGVFGYHKDLTSLKPGDMVTDDATLKSDLSNKPLVSWYFSINYNLTKK